jgi:hypothetical protein
LEHCAVTNDTATKLKDFKGTELELTPNKRANDLSKLNMSDEIESMKITCGG